MSWARLSGSFCFHRKVLEADARTKHRASGAFARMISWSAENMTTGQLSAGVALTIANEPKVLDVLVAVGMLERKGGDYVIHDYCDYNPSGEQLAARREQLRTRRSDAGRQGALVRWGRSPSEGDSPSRRMANEAENHGKPDGNLPCTNMANDAPPDGRLLSASMANDRPQDGKTMPTLTSTSQIPPPTVVDYALAPVEPKAETRGGRKANARVTKHTPEQIAAKDRVMADVRRVLPREKAGRAQGHPRRRPRQSLRARRALWRRRSVQHRPARVRTRLRRPRERHPPVHR
jgi:hypothetical protein